MIQREWFEHGQRFRFDGSVIRTTAHGKLRLAYGDERLQQLRARREDRNDREEPTGRLRRLLSLVATRDRATEH